MWWEKQMVPKLSSKNMITVSVHKHEKCGYLNATACVKVNTV
jgi:hypothetical protein